MFEVGRLVARITLEGAQTVGRELRAVGDEWKNLSDKGKEAAHTVGTTMVGAGVALVAQTGLMIRSAMQWESAWAGVTKTVEGTPAQLDAVEKGLRGLTQVLPASHEEIAAVAEAAGQLGVETKNVVAFTKTMVDLGETTNLTSEEAATSLARFMNVMGTSQDQVSNLGSAIVELGNNYATTEAEILAMATRLSGAGRQIGLTEGEVLGLATSLSSVGIEAEAGGSAISKVMIDIASNVEKGGDKLALFAKTAGMSADDFAAKWKKDPGEALAAFVTGLANAEAQGESTFGILEDLGITEVRMRDALLRSAAAADQFSEAMGTGNKAFAENNALTAEAEKRYATVESQLQMTGNAINDAAIDFGEVFLPAVLDAANGVKDFANFLGDLPPELQGVLAVGTLLTGAVLLLGGTMLLTVPKIVEFRVAMAVLSSEMPRTMAGLKGVAGFLTGPWGLALAGAAIGVALLDHQVEKMKATTEEWQNTLANAKSADDIFEVADKGTLISRLDDATSSAAAFQAKLDLIAHNDFARGFDTSATQLKARLAEVGDELATLATTDLASAQEAFRVLAEDMNLTSEQQLDLLNAMPGYRDALIGQAEALGMNVTTGTEAENNAGLLKLAFGESATAADTAKQAYLDNADAAATLSGEIQTLLDTINEANGVGQDAVTTNADWQASLAGIADEVERQKTAYEEANGTLDGFVLSLDENTAAGSANAAMLADVAADAQAAAEAQYQVDLKTMSAKDATEKYIETLANSKKSMEDGAAAAGFNADEVKRLGDKVFELPDQAEIDILMNTATASQQFDNFVERINGRTVQIYANVTGQTVSGADVFYKPQANGGVMEFYAGGGIRENHVAQIARAGTTRVWAEPETEGEGYIPLAESKRSRSLEILGEIATRFGYALVKDGAKGAPAPTVRSGADGAPVFYVTAAPGEDPLHTARQWARVYGERVAGTGR